MAAESPEGILYVDTSALVKLLVREAESDALGQELVRWPSLATSIITEIELPRAVARAREERPEVVADGSVILRGIIASSAVVLLSEEIAAEARRVTPVEVRALDAIHIASAMSLKPQLAGVATYDRRMQDALGELGVKVAPR